VRLINAAECRLRKSDNRIGIRLSYKALSDIYPMEVLCQRRAAQAAGVDVELVKMFWGGRVRLMNAAECRLRKSDNRIGIRLSHKALSDAPYILPKCLSHLEKKLSEFARPSNGQNTMSAATPASGPR
jgi:hypothetical protein